LESLKQLKPKIYINGEEVNHPLKHPSLLGGLKMVERTLVWIYIAYFCFPIFLPFICFPNHKNSPTLTLNLA